jgi:hypothetical protein
MPTPFIAQICPEYFMPVVIVPALFFFAQAIITHHRKDRLLARLFAEHRDLWKGLGEPRGWKWAPPRGARTLGNRTTIYFDWFSATEPSWLPADPGLREEYRLIRASIRRGTFVGVPSMLGGMLLFAPLVHLTNPGPERLQTFVP